MLKKLMFSFLSLILIFTVVAPSILGATNGVVNNGKSTQVETKQYWDSKKYDDVLYRNAWEKKYYITILDKSTGEIVENVIPTVNGGVLSQKTFEQVLSEDFELVGFKVEDNPSIKRHTDKVADAIITPNVVETAFDIGCFVISLFEFYEDPSLWNGVAVVIDGGAVFLPFVPAVGSLTVTAIQSSQKMETVVHYGIKEHRYLVKDLAYTGYDSHHIMPKKFAGLYGLLYKENNMFAMAVPRDTHNLITGRFNSKLYLPATSYTPAYVRQESYNIYMQLYRETGDYFYKFQADFILVGQYAPRQYY